MSRHRRPLPKPPKPPLTRAQENTRFWIWMGCAVSAMALIALTVAAGPPETPSARIRTACEREYGAYAQQVEGCRIKAMYRALEAAQDARDSRVDRAAGY